MPPRSPLAPASFPAMPIVPGVTLGATACGVRYKNRTDLFLARMEPGSTVAGVFTRSLTAGAPVVWCREALARGRGRIRAIVANSGNANTFTGRAGVRGVDETVAAAVKLFGCKKPEIFVASTGVIGEPLPLGTIPKALPGLAKQLSATAWQLGAEAIMTTDTFAKGATRQASIAGTSITINGIAKGSGMIAPDMGTMFGFLFTDAKIPAAILQQLLRRATERSFNCMTVDGDTSTSDTVLLVASGQAAHSRVASATDPLLKDFRRALDEVCVDLAQQLARDGEGAGKFITINVTGAASDRAAKQIGLSIANSPLVKTAMAAGDANWGRIVMAVGKSGAKADRDRLQIAIGGTQITRDGAVAPGYDEGPVAKYMAGLEIAIDVDIGLGRGKATIWTCDLTHAYIDINASYRRT
ncbi:MAG: bifunctional glutamate N-acetyltransferase/amino-acid acetyltransferase ArgJ [Alphaproteobacteria bacterium]|nr:bifunctional glutamate N-acetyltransferase/amino-acid acetyltransferase ArgJ [Alphaproteobacteria bacterium]